MDILSLQMAGIRMIKITKIIMMSKMMKMKRLIPTLK